MGGKASALGRTNGGGPIDAGAAIAAFMGGSSTAAKGAGAAAAASSSSTTSNSTAPATADAPTKRQLFGTFPLPLPLSPSLPHTHTLTSPSGKKKGGNAGSSATGTKTPKGTVENGVAAAAGTGATSGLPTTADDGTISMTFHQVNQDGAGPLTAAIDATSGGTDPAAFKDAKVTQNVPGLGIGGLSGATTTDFGVKVQMPAGMTCSGTVGGASNVCIVRMQNSALAGPFGGSAAFTQSAAAKKRAVEFNLRKRHFARGILGKME